MKDLINSCKDSWDWNIHTTSFKPLHYSEDHTSEGFLAPLGNILLLFWTEPKPTNIPPDQHWGCAPQLIYDQKRDLLIALTSDRYSSPNDQNSLFVYKSRPEAVIDNPGNWTLQHELKRPWASEDFRRDRPLNKNFYGYPTIAPINEKEYLVVFTERAQVQGAEQADLYYFRLKFD